MTPRSWSTRRTPTVRTLRVSAVGVGDTVILVDRNGRKLTPSVNVDRLAPVDKQIAAKVIWKPVVKLLTQRVNQRKGYYQSDDPWERKADVLACSFRLRARDRCRPRKRRGLFDKYPTATWLGAAQRMWQQGNNSWRRNRMTGWERWADTVSRNQNKRAEAKRAKAKEHHNEGSTESDQAAGLLLRTQRSEADARNCVA